MAPTSEGQGDLPRKDGVTSRDKGVQVTGLSRRHAALCSRQNRCGTSLGWHGVVDMAQWGGKGPEQAPKGVFVLWPLVSIFSQNWSCSGSLAKNP